MDKKSFAKILTILILTFAIALVIKYYRPSSLGDVNLDNFPLIIGQWHGERDVVSQPVLDLLNPVDIFSATYTNSDGAQIHLLFDFFSSDATFGGPHSPRNCLPGSGWVIQEVEHHNVSVNGRTIPAGRFALQFGATKRVMDFWYVTNFGETSNDYVFKLHLLLSSLTFKPRDVAFVRFIANDDPVSLEALEQFQQLTVEEIYRFLPFGN
jgi:EpsI family protein